MLSDKVEFLAKFVGDNATAGVPHDDMMRLAALLADCADQVRNLEDSQIPARARAVPAEAGDNVVWITGPVPSRYRGRGK